MSEKSDASLIWPNLPSATRPTVEPPKRNVGIAGAIFPRLVKPPPNPRREATLRHLDEAIAKLRKGK
jgi:hypothetical protein